MTLLLVVTAICTTQAQKGFKTIGHKLRSGSANSSYDIKKGNQVGIRMNAGHKPVQLIKLNFDVENDGNDSLRFKVNVYEFHDMAPGKNLVTQEIYGSIPHGKNRITVDLEPYNVVAKGQILTSIEWLQSSDSDNHFAIGLFNGGTYHCEDGVWKKTSVAGVDFNMLVKKLNK